MAKLILKNISLEYNSKYKILSDFFGKNGLTPELDSFKTINITKENNFAASLKCLTGGKNTKSVQERSSYIDLIEPLEDIIVSILENTDGKYTILFDELDDKFDGSTTYSNSIVCLLKVADELNFSFYEKNIDAKTIIFLRKDIFKKLEYADLNKIVEGSSIILDWGNREQESSPLLQLITKKIKVSIEELKNCSHEEILRKVFKGPAMQISSKTRVSIPNYILSRTLLRPRDVVNFINKIKSKNRDERYITPKMVAEAESNYSDYLKNEILDELVGHIDRGSALDFFTLLKNMKKSEFTFQELNTYYKEHKRNYKKLDIEKILRSMYLVGAIGSKYKIKTKKSVKSKFHFSWSYKEDESYLNLEHIFCIHNGLKKTLSLL